MAVRIRRSLVGWALVSAVVLASAAGAQTSKFGQPVYPGYQGFLDNPDGSVTMVFQYFSHGRDTVEIPVGERNRFSGVEDRNQPTTFLPGNHEFVCVIVVENREAAQALRWAVAFPEAAVETSLDPLNSEYMLVERSQEQTMRDLDSATAPRGVCIDKPPRVLTNTRRRFGEPSDEIEEVEATLDEPLRLQGYASDEGLPRSGALTTTWSKASGPGTVEFSTPDDVSTEATFSEAGEYELELRGSDGRNESADRIRVKVKSGA